MNFLLNALNLFAADHTVIKTNWVDGFVVFFLGLITIFVVLIVLILFFMLLKLFSGQKKASKDKDNKKPAPAVEPVAQTAREEACDEEIVAAITAAIACVIANESQDGEPAPFVIKKIRHI